MFPKIACTEQYNSQCKKNKNGCQIIYNIYQSWQFVELWSGYHRVHFFTVYRGWQVSLCNGRKWNHNWIRPVVLWYSKWLKKTMGSISLTGPTRYCIQVTKKLKNFQLTMVQWGTNPYTTSRDPLNKALMWCGACEKNYLTYEYLIYNE